ncbi:hypothetical protein EUGRSUZ_G00098 [Eucalyptus grandis]|uniref:Uncharacterized protein n=2 Tax=Eucalyptus grandis TaxID=71139 RepID=A0ACC3K012_EUCGR|nr:hypothetical protein EUGRSUZ_G00098 [Eucalyptus grandis]
MIIVRNSFGLAFVVETGIEFSLFETEHSMQTHFFISAHAAQPKKLAWAGARPKWVTGPLTTPRTEVGMLPPSFFL